MKPSPLFRFPLLPVWLVPFVLLAPVYLAGKALFWGAPLLQFLPWWSLAWKTLLSGHLPLWDPWVGMGAPLLANYQTALFYPVNWLGLLLYALGGLPALAWGQALIVALHLAWAGVGMACLARRLGLSALGQAVCGLAYGLSGYLVARSGFFSINAAAAWLPWVILCLTPVPEETWLPWRRFLALVACLSLQLLAGHAQTTWYTLLLAGLWSAFWALSLPLSLTPSHKSARFVRLLQAWSWLGLAGLLAACLAAVQLLPTAEYLLQSQRSAAVDYAFAMNYSFWPWHLINLLAPNMFGSPVAGDYWGYANYWEDAIYVGVLPLLLALAAVLGSFKRPKPVKDGTGSISAEANGVSEKLTSSEKGNSSFRHGLVWFLTGLFALALLFALGQNTPVFPWLYRRVPTFSMFQAPARFMLWAEFALALLAAIGLESWRRPSGWGLYWTRLGTMGAFAVTLGAFMAWYRMGHISPSFVRATALAGLWGIGAGLFSLVAPPGQQAAARPTHSPKPPARRSIWFSPHVDSPDAATPAPQMSAKARRLWTWGVATFVAIDLLAAGWGLNPSVDLDLYRPSPFAEQVRQRTGSQRLYIPKEDEKSLTYSRFLRFDTFNPGEDWRNMRAINLPDENILEDVASVNNFDPLLPGRYTDWMDALANASPQAQQAMLSLMGVGITETADSAAPYGVQVRERQGASRLHWVPCVHYVDTEKKALALITSGEVDLNAELVRTPNQMEQGMEDQCYSPKGTVAEISIQQENPVRVQVNVNAPGPGVLVLADVWYPGWTAAVDGQPAPIIRGDYLFRSVYLTGGKHQVVFSYHPVSFWSGFLLSLLAGLVFSLLLRRSKLPQRHD